MSKRRDLSLSEKIDLLKKYDDLPKMGQREAANKLGVPQSSLCKILKNRYDVEVSFVDNEQTSRKRKRCGKDEEVENALKRWFTVVRDKDIRVDGPLMKTQAEKLAKKMGKEDFCATDGWLARWRRRENISWGKPAGESGEADLPAANAWLRDVWPSLTAEYMSDSIYNADETGLYFRALPEHTFVFKNDKAKGVKISKERITVLCCASLAGERQQLVVIGKSKKPRCFKNVKKLPVQYFFNGNAWMTMNIFEEWLRAWDRQLTRKILLLVDNCTAHNVNFTLKNIRLVYLPANTTSLIQPCDQGIIRTMKHYYRREMRTRIADEIEEILEKGTNNDIRANDVAKKITLLDAIHLLAKSWQEVTDKTIQNCFLKGGFATPSVIPPDEDDHCDLSSLSPPSGMDEEEFNEWVAIDDGLPTSSALTEEEICADITESNEGLPESVDDEEEGDPILPPPSHSETMKALGTLRRAFQFYGEHFDVHFNYEKYVAQMLEDKKRQSNIDVFFSRKTL